MEMNFINSNDETSSEEKIRMSEEYFNYIVEHIENINMSYQDLFIPLLTSEVNSSIISIEELSSAIILAGDHIKEHDNSKFGNEEFEAYRAKYHSTSYEKNASEEIKKELKEAADEAWKHHYMNNPHHPKYWYDETTKTSKDMSLDYIIEMICDWEAMSIKFKSSTIEWYNTKAMDEKEVMSDKTKEIVEEFLFHILEGRIS